MLSFTPATSYAAGTNPAAIATADFNKDGNLDLATTVGFSNPKVSVRLSNGAGGFGAVQEYATAPAYNSLSLFTADINNDTRPDMVVSDGNSFNTLIGNGDGTFQPAVNAGYGGAVAVGRFDSDGNIDVVVTWVDGDWWTHVQVYRGNGQGGFAAATDGYDTYYSGFGEMAAVDLNNDFKLDMVTGEGVAFLNDGSGRLQFEWGQAALLSGGAVSAGHFTDDGNADVVVAGNDVAVLRGRGDGSFDAPIHHSVSGLHTAVATADFNADGRLDAIVTNCDGATVSVMLGNGDGTLRFGGAFATGTSPSAITVGDFNRDGRPDVAVRDSADVSVLLNDGNWTTVPPAPLTLSINDTTVTEGDTGTLNATFAVTLTRPTAVDVTVRYDLTNITATAATDYVAASGTLTIPAGQTSQTFAVAIKGDLVVELTETFAVNLSNPTNVVIADGQAIGTIIDNEPRPRISINDVSTTEGNSKSPKVFTFTVSLLGMYDQAITVSYATASGTATAGSDYQSKTGSVTFAPGEKTKTITVAVMGDKQKESNETFFVNLSGGVGAEIIDGQGLGTILNDDSVGSNGRPNATASAFDAAIADWMSSGRKKRVV